MQNCRRPVVHTEVWCCCASGGLSESEAVVSSVLYRPKRDWFNHRAIARTRCVDQEIAAPKARRRMDTLSASYAMLRSVPICCKGGMKAFFLLHHVFFLPRFCRTFYCQLQVLESIFTTCVSMMTLSHHIPKDGANGRALKCRHALATHMHARADARRPHLVVVSEYGLPIIAVFEGAYLEIG